MTGNPKTPRSPGAAYLNLYPPAGQTITIGDLLATGRANGFKDKEQIAHLAWDLMHGFITLDGKEYSEQGTAGQRNARSEA